MAREWGALDIYPNCHNVWIESFKTIPTDFLLSPLNRLDLGLVVNWQAHTFMDNNPTINPNQAGFVFSPGCMGQLTKLAISINYVTPHR